ncbi:MAG: thymidylate kinase [Patescibacteria group bacterium]
MPKKGFFIALEGTDGSGKTTQFKLLVKALKRIGYSVKTADFPQYGKPSAYFVEQYLNGRYGSLKQVGPYQASFFYALDRYQASFKINKWLKQGKIVVTNRYVLSNVGHQGGKIKKLSERRKYWQWLFNLEYNILSIPKPDLNIILYMPAGVAQKLVDKKKPRQYINGRKRDIHEADLKHLRAAEQVYLQIARQCHLPIIECVKNSKIITPEEIHSKVLNAIGKILK